MSVDAFVSTLINEFTQQGWPQAQVELVPPERAFLLTPQGALVVLDGSHFSSEALDRSLDRWRQLLGTTPFKSLPRADLLYVFPSAPDPASVRSIQQAMRNFPLSDRTVRAAYVDLATPLVRLDTARARPLPVHWTMTVPYDPQMTAKTLILRALQSMSAPQSTQPVAEPAPPPWSGEGALRPLSPSSTPQGAQGPSPEIRLPFEEALARTTPWGTGLIAAVCLAMFIWESVAGGSTSIAVLLRLGAHAPDLVAGGDWWRLIACAFLHIGPIHFVVNMIALLSVAPTCERMYGNWRFLAMYCVSALTASLLSQFCITAVSAGASGALFGVFGATAVMGRRMRDQIPAHLYRALVGRMVPIIGYNLLFGFTVGAVGNLLLNNAAHIGGLLGGAVFALVVPARLDVRQPRWVAALKPLFFVLAVLPFVVEGWVVWQAVVPPNYARSAPAHYASGGLELDYPSALRVSSKTPDTVELHAPGLLIHVARIRLDSDVTINDLTGDDAAIVAKQAGLRPAGKAEKTDFKGHAWAVMRGDMEGGSLGTLALTPRGKTVASVLLVYDRSMEEQARAITALVCGSLTVSP